jgi:hypothetical protein
VSTENSNEKWMNSNYCPYVEVYVRSPDHKCYGWGTWGTDFLAFAKTSVGLCHSDLLPLTGSWCVINHKSVTAMQTYFRLHSVKWRPTRGYLHSRDIICRSPMLWDLSLGT